MKNLLSETRDFTVKPRCSPSLVRSPVKNRPRGKKSVSDQDIQFEKPTPSRLGGAFRFVTNVKRFVFWEKAIRLRYWEHLGNDPTFKVDWKDISDDSGTEIEYQAKILKKVDGSSSDEVGDNTYESLFKLTLYVTKCKIMIQGNLRKEWADVEFPRLLKFVDAVSDLDPDCDNSTLLSNYNRCFNSHLDLVPLSVPNVDIASNQSLATNKIYTM